MTVFLWLAWTICGFAFGVGGIVHHDFAEYACALGCWILAKQQYDGALNS